MTMDDWYDNGWPKAIPSRLRKKPEPVPIELHIDGIVYSGQATFVRVTTTESAAGQSWQISVAGEAAVSMQTEESMRAICARCSRKIAEEAGL